MMVSLYRGLNEHPPSKRVVAGSNPAGCANLGNSLLAHTSFYKLSVGIQSHHMDVLFVLATVAVAQLVEPWIVIPVVVGSSPISHPNPASISEQSHSNIPISRTSF
jgi:hypothetical protein